MNESPTGSPYGRHSDPGARTGAILVLVVGCVSMLAGVYLGLVVFTFLIIVTPLLAVLAVVFGGIALVRADTDPASARNLVKWGWISLAADAGASILACAAFFFLVLMAINHGDT